MAEAEGSESASKPKGGCLTRFIWALAQQPESRIPSPLRAYNKLPQVVCAVLTGLLFLAFGGFLSMQSGGMEEVVVTYGKGDASKVFTLDKDIEGDVYVHYDLPGVSMNQKAYVESKDKNSVYTFFSAVKCDMADTREWVDTRRGSDAVFMARINAVPGSHLAPCGLISAAMFTDDYVFEKRGNTGWEAVAADESEIALPGDAKSYSKITEESGKLVIDDEVSWLEPGKFFEHWKVWMRTPSGAHVRNLWAIIPGGMTKGEYRVRFLENSAIWDEWGVPEKRLIFSNGYSIGNKGAAGTQGAICIVLGAVELTMAVAFLVLAFLRPSKKLPQESTACDTTVTTQV